MKNKVITINWWKIVSILFILLFIGMVIYLTMTYRTLLQSKYEGTEETKNIVSTSLDVQVNEIYFFQEDKSYHIVLATDDTEQDLFVYVPLEEEIKKENFIVVEAENVLSQEQIENNWFTSCTQCELIKSTPAMINQIPLWELTYKDNSNRYIIEYVTLKDGSIYEQLRLYRKYSERG